nr:hypothetical protein Iba_chr01aCG5370 [Ipomoea batatas]
MIESEPRNCSESIVDVVPSLWPETRPSDGVCWRPGWFAWNGIGCERRRLSWFTYQLFGSFNSFLSVTKKCCKREALHHQISSSPSSSMLRCHHHHCFAVAEGPANYFFNALEESILYSSLFPHKNIAIVSRIVHFSASQFSAIFLIPNLPPLFQERKEKKMCLVSSLSPEKESVSGKPQIRAPLEPLLKK